MCVCSLCELCCAQLIEMSFLDKVVSKNIIAIIIIILRYTINYIL